jgi:small-conductance mechanosensitive channel
VPFNQDPAPVLDDIIKTLRDIVKKERQSGIRKAPEVFFENIEGNNLRLLVSVWISNSRESSFNQARHRLITQVLDALRQKQLLP